MCVLIFTCNHITRTLNTEMFSVALLLLLLCLVGKLQQVQALPEIVKIGEHIDIDHKLDITDKLTNLLKCQNSKILKNIVVKDVQANLLSH